MKSDIFSDADLRHMFPRKVSSRSAELRRVFAKKISCHDLWGDPGLNFWVEADMYRVLQRLSRQKLPDQEIQFPEFTFPLRWTSLDDADNRHIVGFAKLPSAFGTSCE